MSGEMLETNDPGRISAAELLRSSYAEMYRHPVTADAFREVVASIAETPSGRMLLDVAQRAIDASAPCSFPGCGQSISGWHHLRWQATMAHGASVDRHDYEDAA